MPISTKTGWTKVKDEFEPLQKQTISSTNPIVSNSSDLSKTYNINKDVSIDIDQQNQIIYKTSSSFESHYPVFTVAVGVFDIFMLLVIYIVQEGTVLTSDTWIQMGCKYVPCMKPLYSKTEQDMYNADLESQCQSFLFPYQFYRFFTPMFLHGSTSHLLSNLVYQALAGSLLEGKYGTKIFGICYILFGFSGNVMSALSNPKSISVGASGAVYGLLFFCIIDNTLQIFTTVNIQDKIIQSLVTLLVIPYFILSVLFDVDFSGRIDHAAHIGGAMMGIFVAMFLCDMPGFITTRVPYGEKRIQLIALISIIGYFVIALFIFYLFVPVTLK